MAVQTRPDVYYLPAYVALERWLLAKRVAVVSPAGPEGPRRLAAAGAARVLVLAADFEPSPRVEVWGGPLPSPLRLPLRDASIDALLCIEAYAELDAEGRATLMLEALRVLRADGVLVVWSDGQSAVEAELRTVFPEVVALGQQRWSGVRFAPVAEPPIAELPGGGIRLAEDLLPEPVSVGPFLLLASREALSSVLAAGVLVPTAEAPPMPVAAAAAAEAADVVAPAPTPTPLSPAVVAENSVLAMFRSDPGPLPAAERHENPVLAMFRSDPAPIPVAEVDEHSAPISAPLLPRLSGLAGLPVRSPVPSFGPIDESDVLAALFDAPTVNGAPSVLSGPTSIAELTALRELLAGSDAELDGLRQHAATLAEALMQAQSEAIDARTELHELRGRAELQTPRGADEAPPTKPEHEAIGADESSMITRVLVDEVAPMVAPDPPRPSVDVALDRDRLREELTRRTADLQALETRLWESEEEVQKERLENVRLVTDVDRLREQVDRSRVVEHERVQELERLGHELRKLELVHAELQGLLITREQRLRELEASAGGEDDPPQVEELRMQLREFGAQRDQAQALERAASEQTRRRERELHDATRTIRELRRNVEEHASISANLRGELVVMQVEVEQYQTTVPRLQERLRDQQRNTLEREEEAASLQRRLEGAVTEQQHLRQRLRRHKQESEALEAVRDALEVDVYRLRGELEARRKVVEQLQQLVTLGTGTGRAGSDEGAELQGLRAMLAEQASQHAEQQARAEQQQRQTSESERSRLKRSQLEILIRGEEQEFLLYQLDTAEQRIWEMTDATDRSAARLAASLAQLEKQKEQYEDLIDQLEVTRNLLAEAQAKLVELERQLANERAKLARLTLEPGLRIDVVDEDEATDTGAFDILMDEPSAHDDAGDEDSGMEVAPQIQRDPNLPDPLAGIDFDDDEESLAVRLAGPSFTGAYEIANVQIDLDDDDDSMTGRVILPSDSRVRIDLDDDLDDDDEPLPKPAAKPAPRPSPSPASKLLRALPFLDDDEDVFSIDTDAIELATPTLSDRPGFDQKFAEHSNSRIVIEVLDDDAWPEPEVVEEVVEDDDRVAGDDAAKKP